LAAVKISQGPLYFRKGGDILPQVQEIHILPDSLTTWRIFVIYTNLLTGISKAAYQWQTEGILHTPNSLVCDEHQNL
jgi:hypothetical protein